MAVSTVYALIFSLSSVCKELLCFNNFPVTVESVIKGSGLGISLELNIGRPVFVKVVRFLVILTLECFENITHIVNEGYGNILSPPCGVPGLVALYGC